MLTVTITLTTAGADTGPFLLFSDVTGFLSAFETGIDKYSLEVGYTSYLVPDGTSTIRVMSSGTCKNYIDIPLVEKTTTSTSSTTTSTTTSTPISGSITISSIDSSLTLSRLNAIVAPSNISVTVNWGDGNIENLGTSSTFNLNHTYTLPGIYNISLIIDDNSLVSEFNVIGGVDSFDVTAINTSNFPNLLALYCYFNQITSLDISNNLNLISLLCLNNPITSLNLGSNTSLQTLGVDNTLITSLDLSSNTILNTISCQNVPLTSLNINGLNNINVIDLQYGQLTSSLINNVLSQLVANGQLNGIAVLGVQTPPAPPTGQGIIDKATLISRGWNIVTD